MKDHYGRTIDYMRISITDRCNLQCRYCMPHKIPYLPKEHLLTYEEIQFICQIAADIGITKLKITGGEPLVRSGCPQLIGKLKTIPEITQVTMTTNGINLEQHLHELKENGLDAVNISLDTLNPQVYQQITGKDQLPKVQNAIIQSIKAGLPVKLNTVLQTGINENEWPQLIKLTQQYPIDIRFIEMMPIGYGKQYSPVSNTQLLQQIQAMYPELQKEQSIHGNGPAVYYKIPEAKGSIGFISAIHGKFCQTCNRLRLSAHGSLKPCLCYEDQVDLIEPLRTCKGKQREYQIKEKILQAINQKPKEHHFTQSAQITETKPMVQIGG